MNVLSFIRYYSSDKITQKRRKRNMSVSKGKRDGSEEEIFLARINLMKNSVLNFI